MTGGKEDGSGFSTELMSGGRVKRRRVRIDQFQGFGIGVTLHVNCQRCGSPGGVLSGATTRSVSFASNSGDIMRHMVDSMDREGGSKDRDCLLPEVEDRHGRTCFERYEQTTILDPPFIFLHRGLQAAAAAAFYSSFCSRLCGWQPSGGYAPPVGHLRTTPDTRTELILSSSNPETTFRPSPCSPPPGRPLVRLARASSLPASAAFLRDRALSGAEPTAVHIRTKPTRRSRFSAPTRLLS